MKRDNINSVVSYTVSTSKNLADIEEEASAPLNVKEADLD